MQPLPIDAVLGDIVSALATHNRVVVEAATGAGKTTRVPPILLGTTEDRILVLEPRRLAARTAAARIAAEQRFSVGDEVGFHIRFDRRWTESSRIVFVTEGVLLRYLQDDPFLSGVGCVVFDEFHQRSLASDTALALLRSLQASVRQDLLLVIMSATLDSERIRAELNAELIRSEGRTYPVSVEYQKRDSLRSVANRVAGAVQSHAPQAAKEGGSILAFLPGVGEIRRARDALTAAGCPLPVFELFGDLPLDAQHEVLRSTSPRVVLATNVAETSVTVEGVTVVVDGGLHRQLRLDPSSGIDRLELLPISRASADQRAGRAGRQSPGRAVRLWTESEQSVRVDADLPEIHRVDFSGTALYLLSLGENPRGLPWLDPPKPASVQRADRLLWELGALNRAGVTELGHSMARLPLHPRLARLLISAAEVGLAEDGALLAALLSERDVLGYRFHQGKHHRDRDHATTDSDLLDRLDAVQGREGYRQQLQRGPTQNVKRVAQQLTRLLSNKKPASHPTDQDRRGTLSRCLLDAFPDRLALFSPNLSDAAAKIGKRRRGNGLNTCSSSTGGRLVGGGTVHLGHSRVHLPPEKSQLVLCLQFGSQVRQNDRRSTSVHSATLIQRHWLNQERLSETQGAAFDQNTERVVGVRETLYLPAAPEPRDQESKGGQTHGEGTARQPLVLDQAEVQASAEHIEPVLLTAASSQPRHALGLDQPKLARFLLRVDFARRHAKATLLPSLDDSVWAETIQALVPGRRSFDQLREAAGPWIMALLTYEQKKLLDHLAPDRLRLPNGRSAQIQYPADDTPPILAARIQDLFGWQDTPTIADGEVPLQLHLLAPNQRPQQITDDLRGFWLGSYELVRKELAGRYPKHPWPKDPLSAQPTQPRRRHNKGCPPRKM